MSNTDTLNSRTNFPNLRGVKIKNIKNVSVMLDILINVLRFIGVFICMCAGLIMTLILVYLMTGE